MGELSPSDRKKVIEFIVTIPEKDTDKSINLIISLAREVKNKDLTKFKANTRTILKEVYHHSVNGKSVGKALYEIISQGAQHGVIFDPSHVLMAKAVYQAEGLGSQLDPQFRVSEGFEKFTELYLKEKYSITNLTKQLHNLTRTHADLLLEFPEHITKFLKKMEKPPQPPPEHHCEQDHLEKIEEKVERIHHQKHLGSLITTLLLASLAFFYIEGRTDFYGIPFSAILLVIAIIIAIYKLIEYKKGGNENETHGKKSS